MTGALDVLLILCATCVLAVWTSAALDHHRQRQRRRRWQ